LGRRPEQGQVTARAGERSFALFLVERARERLLGAVLAQDPVLGRRQDAPPFVVLLLDLEWPGRADTAAAHPAQSSDPAKARCAEKHEAAIDHDVLLAALVALAPQRFEALIASAIVAVELVADGILQMIILVIVLRLVEWASWRDFRLDRLPEPRLHRLFRGFSQPTQ